MSRPPDEAAARGRSLTHGLATLLCERPIDHATRERAVAHVLDTLACALAGAATPAGRLFTRWARDRPPSIEALAFTTAACAHALELDDLHRASVTHPGCVVVPVALAVAERRRATPLAFLDAVVRGYEACVRVGEAVGPGHYRLFHNTATCGPFGAAAAAASLAGADVPGLVGAFGNAGTTAGGLWQFNVEGTGTKPLHAGHAARSGVVAADLALLGLAGPAEILEGPKGLFAATCPDARPEAVLAEAPTWKLPETSFKPWPSCRHTHPAIEAALRLAPRIDVSRLREIVVLGYPALLDVCDAPEPRTPEQARFSFQHCVAVALARGRFGSEETEGEAISDPLVAAVRSLVRFEVDERYAQAYPRRWGSEVRVALDGGRSDTESVGAALGDPEAPLGWEGLERKAIGLLVRSGFDADRSVRLVGAVRVLATETDPRVLEPLARAVREAIAGDPAQRGRSVTPAPAPRPAAAAATAPPPSVEGARAALQRARDAQDAKRIDLADAEYRRAIEIFTIVDEVRGAAEATQHLARLRHQMGDHAASADLYKRALVLYRNMRDVPGEAELLRFLGILARDRKATSEAEKLFAEAAQLFARLEDRNQQAATLYLLSALLKEAGHAERAERTLTEAKRIYGAATSE